MGCRARAKAILIRPAPVPGYQGSRSFALPEFDPFWKRVVELDVLVTMHASDSGYSRYTADWEAVRFPDLKIAVIENGATWLPPLLDILADVYKKAPEGFAGDPVAAIKRSIHVSPFWEEDVAALSELIGVERVLFGSDFPHPEGLAQPTRYIEEIKDMPLDAQKLIMGGNLTRLMSATNKA